MEVIVEVKCGRCSKKDNRSLSLEEAQALSAKADKKNELEADLQSALNTILTSDHPDIIIAIRAEGADAYAIKHLDNLCDAPGAKRNKGCKTRVETLLGDIFMTNEVPPKAKKPSVKKKTQPKETISPEGDNKK